MTSVPPRTLPRQSRCPRPGCNGVMIPDECGAECISCGFVAYTAPDCRLPRSDHNYYGTPFGKIEQKEATLYARRERTRRAQLARLTKEG